MTKTRIASLSLGLTLAASGIAHAHATFEKDTAPVESTFKAVLQVPHGCDGKPTTEVQIKLPEGFVFAQPQPKPGWEIEIIKGDYQKTYDNHGKKVTSGPLEIRWKGGNLPDEYYDTFVVRGKVSGFDKETVLAFPITQLCGTEGKVVWDQVAAEGQNAHDLKSPAPTVTVTMADAADPHAGHGGHMAAAGGSAKVGDLDITGGSVKAMLPGAKVGGGFLTIKTGGAGEDRLVAVESPAAARVEIHEMKMENDVMRMRKLDDGVALPAGETVEFKAGGLHLMFMDVKTPFKEGETVPVTLVFEKAGKVDATFPVGSAKGGEAAGGQKHH